MRLSFLGRVPGSEYLLLSTCLHDTVHSQMVGIISIALFVLTLLGACFPHSPMVRLIDIIPGLC